ncbi:unnamed protein product, partial [Mesorhabditis spiculigera]
MRPPLLLLLAAIFGHVAPKKMSEMAEKGDYQQCILPLYENDMKPANITVAGVTTGCFYYEASLKAIETASAQVRQFEVNHESFHMLSRDKKDCRGVKVFVIPVDVYERHGYTVKNLRVVVRQIQDRLQLFFPPKVETPQMRFVGINYVQIALKSHRSVATSYLPYPPGFVVADCSREAIEEKRCRHPSIDITDVFQRTYLYASNRDDVAWSANSVRVIDLYELLMDANRTKIVNVQPVPAYYSAIALTHEFAAIYDGTVILQRMESGCDRFFGHPVYYEDDWYSAVRFAEYTIGRRPLDALFPQKRMVSASNDVVGDMGRYQLYGLAVAFFVIIYFVRHVPQIIDWWRRRRSGRELYARRRRQGLLAEQQQSDGESDERLAKAGYPEQPSPEMSSEHDQPQQPGAANRKTA